MNRRFLLSWAIGVAPLGFTTKTVEAGGGAARRRRRAARQRWHHNNPWMWGGS